MIDLEVLALVAINSFVLYKIVEALKDRLGSLYADLSDRGKECFGYAVVIIVAALMWFTSLNAVPGFKAPIGQILTCIVAGFGPGVVYDLWADRPEPPG